MAVTVTVTRRSASSASSASAVVGCRRSVGPSKLSYRIPVEAYFVIHFVIWPYWLCNFPPA